MSTLLNATITAAVTADANAQLAGTRELIRLRSARYLTVQALFTYGSGGATAKAWLQTSLDGGVTWIDIACFSFTTATAAKVFTLDLTAVTTVYTPTDGTLANDTVKNGIIGDQLRIKYTTTNTYAGGTTLKIDVQVRG